MTRYDQSQALLALATYSTQAAAARSLGTSVSTLMRIAYPERREAHVAAKRAARAAAREAENKALDGHATAPAEAVEDAPDPVVTRAANRRHTATRRERDVLADRCLTLEGQLAQISAPASRPLPPITLPPARTGGLRPAVAVALFSDVHAGETVERTSAVDNYYSRAVCESRLHRYFEGVGWLIRNNRSWADIQRLVLWFGGDLITGHIHDELAETSESAIETMVWLEPLLVAGVKGLSKEVDVSLVCSYGNHGRDTHKIRRATGALHSHEWGLYQRLPRQLPGVDVLADRGGHQYLEVFGKTLHFHHGDEIRYGGGVGGIMIPGNKAVAAWDRVRRADVHHFGHYHQYLDAGNIVFNGSLKGYDAFAMSIKASPEPPQQAFYVLDAARGRTACSPVWVVDRPAESEIEKKETGR